jgi:hypothetical protein
VRAPAWSPETSGAAAPDRALEEAKRTLATRCWELGGAEEAAVTASPHLASLRSAGAGAAILAPLVVRGEVLGVLTLARGAEMRYDAADVELAQDLATLVALALHDARLLRSIEAAAEARDDILAMAKHELRTPVTVLALEAAQLARTATDARTQRRADAIRRATSRLARAIEQLLDIAHIADGHPRLDREPLDLVRLVHQTMARVSPEVERVGCPIHLVAPDRLPASGDRLRIDGALHASFQPVAVHGQVEVEGAGGFRRVHLEQYPLAVHAPIPDWVGLVFALAADEAGNGVGPGVELRAYGLGHGGAAGGDLYYPRPAPRNIRGGQRYGQNRQQPGCSLHCSAPPFAG